MKIKTWYEVIEGCDDIQPVEVIRETSLQLVLVPGPVYKKERKVLKRLQWRKYFPSRKEAQDYIVNRHEGAIKRLTEQLAKEQESLKAFLLEEGLDNRA